MKRTLIITAFAALVLIIGILLLRVYMLLNETNVMGLLIAIVGFQFLCWGVLVIKKRQVEARQFLLSGLIILVIGTSSCVTIVPRKKKKPPKPPVEKPVTDSTKTT